MAASTNGKAPIETDVLVIGAGGSGLRAAIEASNAGAKVTVICKSLLGKAHTIMAEGGIAAAVGSMDPDDNWKVHFKDTMFGGKYVNNWRMAEIHAKEAPEEIKNLERWGAVFDRNENGKVMQRIFGGHQYRRLVQVGDRTGLELIRTLQDRAVAGGLDVYMEHTVTALLKSGDRVVGAIGYKRQTGEIMQWRAKAIVLACGGAGRIYSVTSNSWEGTADGHWLALNAGADLLDMEFIQFHPTGMVWPQSVRGILVTEAVRAEGGLLTNSKGERFMEKYDPKRMELSTRDVVARSIYTEVKEGRGSPHGGAFLSIAHKPADFIKKKLPSMYHQFMDFALVDITKEAMEVFPTTHYIMGGVRVDPETAATTLPGLFAAGESAGGLHGGNRLGGNSLSDLLVFGKHAGAAAAAYAKGNASLDPDPRQIEEAEAEMLRHFTIENGTNPYAMQERIQEIMTTGVGVFRTEEGISKAIAELEELAPQIEKMAATGPRYYNPSWHTAVDVKGMHQVAKAIANSALLRRESRSSHTRADFPKMDDEFQKINHVTRKKDGVVEIEVVVREPIPDYLADIAFEREKVGT